MLNLLDMFNYKRMRRGKYVPFLFILFINALADGLSWNVFGIIFDQSNVKWYISTDDLICMSGNWDNLQT